MKDWTIAALVWLAFAIVMPLAGSAHAETVMQYVDPQGSSVTLRLQPCITPALVDAIRPEHLSKFQSGTVFYKGASYEMCWYLAPDGYVNIIDTGTTGMPDIYAIAIGEFEAVQE